VVSHGTRSKSRVWSEVTQTQPGCRSITANLRVDFCGRGELADRQQKLGQLMSALKKIAEQFNVAVVITNQVRAAISA